MGHIQRRPLGQIAQDVGVHRNTVSKLITRITKELNTRRMESLEDLRQHALSTYDAIQKEAWERLQSCSGNSNSAVGFLGIISQARRQQDRLLGLEQVTINHTETYLKELRLLMDQPVPIAVLPSSIDEAEIMDD
jgi:hypothetical protein